MPLKMCQYIMLFLITNLFGWHTNVIAAEPIKIKMVIVTMFEIGEDQGDAPGEFQLWKERLKLDTKLPLPHSHHDLYLNKELGILGMVTGMGTNKSSSAVMAVGLDPRLDLSKAYWLVAGIAGVDPEDASVGSAAWAKYLIDGDLAHEIDAREIPKEWEVGYFPYQANQPYDPKKPANKGEMFKLNESLVDWAFAKTKDIDLGDDDAIKKHRSLYKGYPNAQKPPFVLIGDQLAAMTFWHGKILNDWANKWTKYWTDGKGEFVTSAMEDTGSYQSVSYLHESGKVDKNRFLVLRTASNYTMQPPGITAADNFLNIDHGGYAGLNASLESAYKVGEVIVKEIVDNWSKYENNVP
jgi:purine nucleoside permease